MRNVVQILTSRERTWTRERGATEQDIAGLHRKVPLRLPDRYIELLRYSNGGEGPLALSALYFQLYEASFAADFWHDAANRSNFPQYFFIGSNGGLEYIGFEIGRSTPWPIVMVDRIAGSESAVAIARDIDEFIEALGLSAAHDA